MSCLISFESLECGGKGTTIRLLGNILRAQEVPFVIEREPGGTRYGEGIRAMLKHPELALPAIESAFANHGDRPETAIGVQPDFSRTPECELFLFWASRAQFVAEKVKPALERGCYVIADRLYDSTYAYQGGGRFEADPEMLEFINFGNAIAMQRVRPVKTILLNISVETMRRRLANESSDKMAIFERLGNDFYERAREAYLHIAREEPDRVIVVNAERSVPEVFEEVLNHLRPILGIR